jgi:hypothetical protein
MIMKFISCNKEIYDIYNIHFIKQQLKNCLLNSLIRLKNTENIIRKILSRRFIIYL